MLRAPLTARLGPLVLALGLVCACAEADSGSAGTDADGGGVGPVDTGSGGDTGTDCEPTTWYADTDGDGFGEDGSAVEECERPTGHSDVGGDCDDTDATIHPGAEELCSGIDEDCDGELDPASLYEPLAQDADGDGYGDGSRVELRCPAEGWVADTCDCDDTDPLVHVDPTSCPPVDCPEAGGLWRRGACATVEEVVHDGTLVLAEDAGLTMCPGTHSLSLTVQTDHVRVWGPGADAVTWTSTPALVLDREGARVELEGLSLVSGTHSTSGTTGVIVRSDAGGTDVRMQDVTFGETTAGVMSTVVAEIDGSLRMTDSLLTGIVTTFGDTYSTSCNQVGLRVTGDLRLVRTEVTGFDMGCWSASHSAVNEAVATAVEVGGDLLLEEVRVSGNELVSSSSGVGAVGTLALFEVAGDVQATDLEVSGNTVESYLYCSGYTCSRELVGGLFWLGGGLRWDRGILSANGVGVDGYLLLSDTSWEDQVDVGPIYWLPAEGATLELIDVDLGSEANPDISGAVEYDGSGVSSVTCDASGCG